VEFALLAPGGPFLFWGFATRLFQCRYFFEAHRECTSRLFAGPVQGGEQGHLQEAEAKHQVDPELRRQRIALVGCGQDPTARLVQTGIVYRYTGVTAAAEGPGLVENRLEEVVRLPGRAGMQSVVGTPVQELTAFGPEGTGERAATQGDEGTQGLAEGTPK
jgi:hypothetical protein